MMRLLGLIELATLRDGDPRPYVGPTEVHASAEASHAEAASPTSIPTPVHAPASATPTGPVASTPIDPGERWRLAVLLSTQGFVGLREAGNVGAALGGFVGAGIPVKQRPGRRTRHAFGYAGDVSFAFADGIGHRHRVAATGLVGSNRPLFRRTFAFYYFAGFGAGIRYVRDAGPSFGVRVGLASSKRLDYILAFGSDLDLLVTHYPDARGIRRDRVLVAPSINLSLLTFGSL